MSEIKPCPFCGKIPNLQLLEGKYYLYCFCLKEGETKQEAIAAWNSRVVPEGYVKVEDVLKILNKPMHPYTEWYDEIFDVMKEIKSLESKTTLAEKR